MVDATVDNDPVSILIESNQSTTVPSNETWRVSIHITGGDITEMSIDGIGKFKSDASKNGQNDHLEDVTLTGGQTVAMTTFSGGSGIFITGFVVNS